jgi:hypothetical protein
MLPMRCLAVMLLGSMGAVSPGARADVPPSTTASRDASEKNRRLLRLVVTDFDVEGLPPRTARIVADNLVAELRKLNGVSVVGMSEVRAMLAAEADRQSVGCTEGVSCLAEIADALGADILIAGRIGVLEGASVLSIRRIDQAQAQVVGTVEDRLQGTSGTELLAAIGPAVQELFPEVQVKAGVERGVPKERALVLNPPPLPVWSTVSVAAAAVVVAGVGTAFGVLSVQSTDTAQDLVDGSAKTPVEGALIVRQQQTGEALATAANVTFVGAVVVGAAAGVMALFTDWMGYAAAASVE